MGDSPEDFTSEEKLYPGTLRGYRYWRVNRFLADKHGTPLTGVSVESFVWEPTGNCAKCVYLGVPGYKEAHSPDSIPHPECQCGFYAWYDPQGAIQNHGNSWMGIDGDLVLGVIEASGLIVPGSKGFRAEKADIVALVPGRNRISGYPVHLLSSVDDLIQGYPPQKVAWKKPETTPTVYSTFYTASWIQNVINSFPPVSWNATGVLSSIPSRYVVKELTNKGIFDAIMEAENDLKNPSYWVVSPGDLYELSKSSNIVIDNGTRIDLFGFEVTVDYTAARPYLVAE